MRVSYKSHPILKILETGDLSLIKCHSSDRVGYLHLMEQIKKHLPKYISHFKPITFLSIPFITASAKAENRLIDLYHDITESDITNDICVMGTFVAGPGITMIFRKYNNEISKTETAMFGFQNEGYPLFSFVENSENLGEGSISPLFAQYNNIKKEDAVKWLQYKCRDMIVIQMFKSYAEVETKLLLPGQKIKTISCKYLNETKLKITYLDSKWFTNLVKSDAFKVSGHFRLQPKKKDGEWTKELIWINEFEKSGYTSKTKIL